MVEPGQSKLNNKQQMFIEHYLLTCNSSQAARLAGYSEKTAYQAGHRLLRNGEVRDAISARMEELGMGANEVIGRLSQQARADLGEYIGPNGALDVERLKSDGASWMLKKFKHRKWTDKDGNTIETVEVELHDAQAALVHLGRYHKLWVDRQEHSGRVEVTIGDAKSRLMAKFNEGTEDGAEGDSVPLPASANGQNAK